MKNMKNFIFYMKNTECNIAYKLFILSISVINKELPWELAVNLRTEN